MAVTTGVDEVEDAGAGVDSTEDTLRTGERRMGRVGGAVEAEGRAAETKGRTGSNSKGVPATVGVA